MPNTVDTLPYPEPLQEISAQNQDKFRTADVISMGFAHGVHDLYDAFIAPLLPVLIETLSLTKTMAGSLSIFLQIPSLIQPFIGHIADRVNLQWVVIAAPAAAGILLSLIGIPNQFWVIALLVMLAGIVSSGIHAIGPVITGNISGKRLGLGMSIWMVGGEVGRVLGPVIIVTVLGTLTLKGLPWLMIGGIAASALLYLRLRKVTGLVRVSENGGVSIRSALQRMKPLMLPLTVLLIVRAFMNSALTTYLPTFLTDEGANLWFAGVSLSVLQTAGVAGAFLAGPLSDRLGRRKVMLYSLIGSPLFMLLFLLTNGWLQFPILLLLGFFSISLTPVLMAAVQETCPDIRSTANGIFMALNFVALSACVLVIGLIGDNLGLRVAYYISAALMLVAVPAVFLFPNPETNP
jgi:FSR family fosmidomycin resistance protein-like MFS transporter